MEDWNILKTCFILNAPDDSDTQSDDSPHFFHDNKIHFEYKIKNLKDTRTLITRLNVQHNNQKSAKQYSAAATRLQYQLYLCDGKYVILM